MFEKGQSLYTLDGNPVEFDHEHDGVAYVYPVQSVIIQCTTYHGDDFHEEEDEQLAGHLITVPMDKLVTRRPVAAIDAEIAAKQEELAKIKSDASIAIRATNDSILSVGAELRRAERKLEEWKEKHRTFEILGRLLDGEELFPLNAVRSPYRNGWRVPHIPKWKDVSIVTLHHHHFRNESAWSVKHGPRSDNEYQIQFFDTEEERTEKIADLFEETCERFRKNPKYSTEGKTYSTGLDYGTLQRWCETHTHLSIPEDIEQAKAESDAAAKAARAAKLKAELEALEG